MSIAAGAVAGAIGGGLAVTVLAPLSAANNFIGSFFFGNGMIVGERKAYQEDWPKIKARLDKGESFISILEEYTTENTTAVMQTAKMVLDTVTPIWFEMVTVYLKSIPQELLTMVTNPSRETSDPSLGKAGVNATVNQATYGLIPQVWAEEQIQNTNIPDRPSYFDELSLGQLQTRYLRETNTTFKLTIYREIQMRLQKDPSITAKVKKDPSYSKITTPIISTINMVGAGVSKETDKTKKLALLNNAKNYLQQIKVQEENLKRLSSVKFVQRKAPRGSKGRASIIEAKYKSTWYSNMSLARGKIGRIINDLRKKYQNTQTLLKNYR